MKHKIVLVDDEPAIAEGLRFMIQRLLPECEVTALAYNGKDGYDKVLAMEAEIVITDIRMPDMDGIEMLRKLKEVKKNIHCIILSGYAEFEYARSAIKLGVSEYITKPVDEKELCDALRRICSDIDEQRSRQQSYERREFDFPDDCRAYSCAMLELNGSKQKNLDNMAEHVRTLSKRYLDFCREYRVIENSDTVVTIVMAMDERAEQRLIQNRIAMIRLELAEASGDFVSAGVSMIHGQVQELKAALEEARCAWNYKIIKGLDCCISYEQIRDIQSETELISEDDLRKLEQAIDTMDEKLCKQVLDSIFYKISKEKELSLEQLKHISLNLLLTGIRKMPFMQFQLNEYLGKNIFSLDSISKFKTLEQLKNWIYNVLKSMNELMLKDCLPARVDLVEEAKEYIRKNFNKDISLNDISEKFFINPTYFSQLFKKKTGKTYQNYLTELRVTRARRLLDETDYKIYEICTMVGYTDVNHFTRVFERAEGVKPSEYRKRKTTG